MKNLFSFLSLVLLLVGRENGFSQGTFVNLDFEHPVTPLSPVSFLVPTTNAIPGWTGYAYGNSVDSIYYNTVTLGAASPSLQGPGSLDPVIQGSYTVYLQGSTGGPHGSAAVGQIGQIPLGTQSLIFWGSLLNVSFDGQTLPLNLMGVTPNYGIVGADVSAFAGQTGELLFTAPVGAFTLLDNIQFSTSPIPEPSTFALFAFGSLFLHLRRRQSSVPIRQP